MAYRLASLRKFIEFPWVFLTCILVGGAIFFYDFPLDIFRSSAEISNKTIGKLYESIPIGMHKDDVDKVIFGIDNPAQFKVIKRQGVTYVIAPWNFYNEGGGWTLKISYCKDLVIGVNVTEQDTGKNPKDLYSGKVSDVFSCK